MKKKLAVTLALTSMLLLASLLALAAYAQDPTSSDDTGGEIGELGLADPPPAGLSILYMFTGVANHPISTTRQIATSVHCTNFGSAPINSNRTWTFSTQNTAIYREDTILSPGILEQGSGRGLADKSQLICTAQVLDPFTNPLAYISELEMFKP